MPEPADESPRPLCASTDLAERGRAFVFDVIHWRHPARAFVLRFEGRVVAYLNQCVHVPTEMDWQPGEFLDDSKNYILCSIHGAGLRTGRRTLRRRSLRPRALDAAAG
jgi:nitrite reductase/ring-hydroxylating ferredoxin subunit